MPLRLSISGKVTLVLWGVSVLVLVVGGVSLATYEAAKLEERVKQRLRPLANVFEVSAGMAVKLQDRDHVGSCLQSIGSGSQILAAYVFVPAPRVVAPPGLPPSQAEPHYLLLGSFEPPSGRKAPTPKPPGLYFSEGSAEMVSDVHVEGEPEHAVGRLHLVIDLAPVNAQSRQALMVFGAGVLVVAAGTLAQSWLLRRSVTRPIAVLASLAESVREQGDVQTRAPTGGHDEVARLGERFNDMLDAVQKRDAALKGLVRDLETKNRELGSFTHTVSHDLRSPLLTVKAYAESLIRDVASGRTQHLESDLRGIVDAAGHMGQLLSDLLELSKGGRVVNPGAPVEVRPLVLQVVRLLMGILNQKDVEVVVQDPMPVVQGDPHRLAQVFQNLLENAVKYRSPDAPVHIEIGSRTDGVETVLFVRDNGVGIPEASRAKVFELFARLDPRSAGTGIGLALARRIIEVHGGRIWVESDGPGKGSCFCFTLASGIPAEQYRSP